jgi:DNA-binding beta-propeller fold protein YncE
VLDRLRNAVFELDVPGARIMQGLRAGQGATNAVTDRFGRVLVTDTRGGALLAFSLDPLLMRQNYPVPGAPYAIAYDEERDLAWVTLTETNEVVGYDVAGEEPEEKYRFPTVSQPNTVAVDPRTGRVLVASGTGDGIQVITP